MTVLLRTGLLALLLLPLAVAAACGQELTREAREVDGDFSALNLSVPATAYVRQGEAPSVELEGKTAAILDKIEVYVRRGQLVIEAKDQGGLFGGGDRLDEDDLEDLSVYVTMTTVEGLRVSGAGSIVGQTLLRAEDLTLNVSGAGGIEAEVEARDVRTGLSGAGDLDLTGSARAHDVRVSGAGSVNAADFVTEATEVRVSGAADCRVHATGTLAVRISGVGSVRYRGEPEVTRRRISGVGSLRPLR